jgi:hypothetical protein
MPDPQSTADQVSPVTRQCGRCRLMFDGDTTAGAVTPPKWWLCPPCHSALLGDRHNPAFRSRPIAATGS